MRQNPPTGHFSRRVLEKNQNQVDKGLYFTYLPRRSLTVTLHTFELRVRLVDVISCAKFYGNQLRDLDIVRVEF